jgi:hypothetical protein
MLIINHLKIKTLPLDGGGVGVKYFNTLPTVPSRQGRGVDSRKYMFS